MTAKKRPSRTDASRRRRAEASASSAGEAPDLSLPVVAIGASAGGLEALEELFGGMPIDTGMAFVIVTHQLPGRTSLLPELLSRKTAIPVTQVVDGARLQPNHIYVGPPGAHLAVVDSTLRLLDSETAGAPRLPIDHFLRSLARDRNTHAIAVILSGTGQDGTIGLQAIKSEAGTAIVQDPASAKYAGMPSSAIGTGLADFVLTPTAIPGQLLAWGRGSRPARNGPSEGKAALSSDFLRKVLVLLRARTGHDFSEYKSNTIRRRVDRRMTTHRIREPARYVRFLQENPREVDLLFRELLISVTSFFRDGEAFDALRTSALPELLDTRPDDHTLRVWVPGCATGEEVYSLAITLLEVMEQKQRRLSVQIFGTDLDGSAIDRARSGRFPEGIASAVPGRQLERYFIRDGDSYRVRKEVRELAIFAQQDVIKDPPFTKLDVLSCRNLLIYLDAELQGRLLPVFHYSLVADGLLVLGPSETTGAATDLFEPVDKKWKIYRRREPEATPFKPPAMPHARSTQLDQPTPRVTSATRTATAIDRVLLSRFCPTCVVANERGDIVHVQGRTGAYLEPAEGHPRMNVLDMAREGLAIKLAAAIRKASRTEADVIRDHVRITSNGGHLDVTLTVSRIPDSGPLRGLLLIVFRDADPLAEPVPAAKGGTRKRTPDRREELERELLYAQESLRTTVEELETSNEELTTTNEELQSTNEELQSTNEELETSKEEMQSLNEELTTVNAELQSKVEELFESNNDMQNLLNSTNIATVFLDDRLRIKRFTEEAKELVNLLPGDVGRPISDLASTLRIDDLHDRCRAVLATLIPVREEVRSENATHYLMRIMPYRTAENVIDGLVLTFVNIDELRRGGTDEGEALEYVQSVAMAVREPVLILDDEQRVVSGNLPYFSAFRTTARRTLGRRIFEVGNGEWDTPPFRALLEEARAGQEVLDGFELAADFAETGRRRFAVNVRRFRFAAGWPGLTVLAMEEVR